MATDGCLDVRSLTRRARCRPRSVKEALHIIRISQAKVTFDETVPEKPVVGIEFPKNTITDKTVAAIKELKSLRSLKFEYCSFGKKVGLPFLKDLPQLETLDLTWSYFEDAMMDDIKAAKSASQPDVESGGRDGHALGGDQGVGEFGEPRPGIE